MQGEQEFIGTREGYWCRGQWPERTGEEAARLSTGRQWDWKTRKVVRNVSLDRSLQLVLSSRLSRGVLCGEPSPARVSGAEQLEMHMNMAMLASECSVKSPASCL